MSQSSLLAPTGTIASSPADMVWEHPTRKVKVCMCALPGALISGKAVRALAGSEPSEIGGILLGIVEHHADEVSIAITAVEFIEPEGAYFNSTAADSQALALALKGHSPSADSIPIGFVRSQTREGLCLSEQDKAFVEQYFADSVPICLLVRPFDFGVCMAGVFLWEKGRPQTGCSDFEVPLFAPRSNDSEAPAHRLRLLDKAKDSELPEGAVEQQPSSRLGAGQSTGGWIRGHARIQTVALVCLAVALLTVVAYNVFHSPVRRFRSEAGRADVSTSPPETKLPRAEIGIQVTRPAPGQINLSWNPDLFPDALGGQLDIAAGLVHQKLILGQNDLRSGRLAYFSGSQDLVFQMRVDLDKNRSLQESIRVVGEEREPASSKATPVTKPNTESRIGTAHRGSSSSQSGSTQSRYARFRPSVSPMSIGPKAGYSLKQAPVLVSSPTEPPPELAIPLSVPVPYNRAQVPKRADGSAAAPPDYIAPVPLRQVNPDVRSVMPAGSYAPISVEVAVKLDRSGNVIEAHAVHPGLLSTACVAAASKWRFSPATLHGRPIETTYSIKFRFRN